MKTTESVLRRCRVSNLTARCRRSQPFHTTRVSRETPSQHTATATTPSPSNPGLGYAPSWLRRNRAALAWSFVGLSAGIFLGNTAVNIICAPPLPAPGTPQDRTLLAELNQRIDDEFKVKVLRGKCLGVSKQLKGGEGGWVEIIPRPGPTRDEVLRKSDGFIDTIQGARGLGTERVFYNRDEEKLVAVIWFGGALSGWPNVTHGGVIATQLAEKIALTAALGEEKRARRRSNRGEQAAAVPQRLPGTGAHAKMYGPERIPVEPAQLSLSYVKPTYANNFYVIRVSHAMDLDRDPEDVIPDEPASGRHEYEAVLESMDSRINVKAKAKILPSKLIERVENKVVDSTKQTYTEFKQWLWPSRQGSSQP